MNQTTGKRNWIGAAQLYKLNFPKNNIYTYVYLYSFLYTNVITNNNIHKRENDWFEIYENKS